MAAAIVAESGIQKPSVTEFVQLELCSLLQQFFVRMPIGPCDLVI